MYKNARAYLMQGNTQQALITYQQAIKLAPDKMILYRDLGQAYHSSGSHTQAIDVLEPVIKSGEADDQEYHIYAASLLSKNDRKKAKAALQEGLKKFPNSGPLYHETGLMLEEDKDLPSALRTWLTGIEFDPSYHLNYYEAARTYMGTYKPVWAVIYAEVFLNIEKYTPRADETRDMLLGAYMRLYESLGTGELPKFKEHKSGNTAEAGDSFEDAVLNTYLKLSPVVSDGITTENLTMLRTRFMMEWSTQYAGKYPFSMFSRMNDMLRDGYFDAYNQWVFGNIDNHQVFEAWKTFHPDALPAFETWLEQHPFKPAPGEFYNPKQVDGIFKIQQPQQPVQGAER